MAASAVGTTDPVDASTLWRPDLPACWSNGRPRRLPQLRLVASILPVKWPGHLNVASHGPRQRGCVFSEQQVPPSLLFSRGGALFGAYEIPTFAQLTMTSYHAASSAYDYAISRMMRQIEKAHLSGTDVKS